MIAILAWLKTAWAFIASSRIAQGVILAVSLIGYHLTRMRNANLKGRKQERTEAKEKAVSRRAEVRKEIDKGRDEARKEIEKQEAQDEADPSDRFGRDPWS